MKEKIVKYKGRHIVVYFTVDRCTHVAECLRGAPDVFDTTRRPWIQPDAEPAEKVAEVVMRCPTGALHFERLEGGPEEPVPEENIITLNPDGPLYFRGNLEVYDPDKFLFKDTRLSFCRCGQSTIMPFCNGFHIIADFKDDAILASESEAETPSTHGLLKIRLMANGPLLVSGPFLIKDAEGNASCHGDKASLCRCGGSKNPPFCDGTHKDIGFSTE